MRSTRMSDVDRSATSPHPRQSMGVPMASDYADPTLARILPRIGLWPTSA